MKPQWFVRTYREGDEYGIAKLMELGFGEDEVFWRRLWLWECKKNPNGHVTMVAEHDGQIVGHMSLVLVDMKIGSKTMSGAQAVDLIVHPSFRHQGMFLTLGKKLFSEARRKGICVSFGFPNREARSGHLKYGWFDVCNVPRLVKFLNIHNALCQYITNRYKIINLLTKYRVSKFFVQLLLRVASMFAYLVLLMFGRDTEHIELQDVKVARIARFDDRIDNFWKDVSKDYPIIVVRNSNYLNWRYFQKPGSKYTVFVAESNGKILGYMVLLITKGKSGCMVDMLTYPDKSIIQLLLSKAIKHFKREKMNWIWIASMLRNSLYHRILRDKGFILVPSESPLIAHLISPQISGAFVKDAKNWHITFGDTVDRSV